MLGNGHVPQLPWAQPRSGHPSKPGTNGADGSSGGLHSSALPASLSPFQPQFDLRGSRSGKADVLYVHACRRLACLPSAEPPPPQQAKQCQKPENHKERFNYPVFVSERREVKWETCVVCVFVWGKVSIETRPVNPPSCGRRRERL